MVDMDFLQIQETCELLPDDQHQLQTTGFVVLLNLVLEDELLRLQDAYDLAMATGEGDDYKAAGSTTRLHDFVNRGAAFDSLYVQPSLLAAACSIIEAPFKLSNLLGRTLRARTVAQELHVDLSRNSDAFPMVGFILMIDDFRKDNGATRFIPGSHLRNDVPSACLHDLRSEVDDQVLACGKAGSVIVFHASAWHGHTGNYSDDDRRSIQGYFVPRAAQSGSQISLRMKAETMARLGPLAKYILAV